LLCVNLLIGLKLPEHLLFLKISKNKIKFLVSVFFLLKNLLSQSKNKFIKWKIFKSIIALVLFAASSRELNGLEETYLDTSLCHIEPFQIYQKWLRCEQFNAWTDLNTNRSSIAALNQGIQTLGVMPAHKLILNTELDITGLAFSLLKNTTTSTTIVFVILTNLAGIETN
jgi:hypothetical protein